MTRLVIGLGNPGKSYENTFHNVGRFFIDYLSGGETAKKERLFDYWKLNFGNGEIVAVKTKTFMNESGLAVRAALGYFHAHPESLIIAHDDSDLGFLTYKLARGRGAAGHKGVLSVMEALGTKDFYRLRIGVRQATHIKIGGQSRRLKAGGFVLKKMGSSDQKRLFQLFGSLKTMVSEKETLPDGS